MQGPDAPRSERDAVHGKVEARRSEISTEKVFETRAGLYEVEQVSEGLRLAEMVLELVCPDVIVQLERDGQI